MANAKKLLLLQSILLSYDIKCLLLDTFTPVSSTIVIVSNIFLCFVIQFFKECFETELKIVSLISFLKQDLLCKWFLKAHLTYTLIYQCFYCLQKNLFKERNTRSLTFFTTSKKDVVNWGLDFTFKEKDPANRFKRLS